MFAKRLLLRGNECWAEPQGLGHVPVKWSADHSKWVAGNRHRVMAAKVAGYIKLAIEAGKANPAPPIGPALGAKVRFPSA